MQRWDLIATERRALADLLEGLTPEQWSAPSLCGHWSVRQVAAHTMVGPTASLAEFAAAMIRARGRFHVANRTMVDNRASLTDDELVAVLRDRAEHHFTPPGHDWHAPLSDVMIHREDVAVPLGIPQDRPVETWREVLGFLVTPKARSSFIGRDLPAVRLVATDLDWSHGTGPEVTAPATAIALALCGRPALVDRLAGDGAATLAAWTPR